nr:Type 1 glutamine amidotransferase-like domain-containing protein [Halomarina rubra]
MSHVVAIGGGEIADVETEPLDRYVRDLVDAETPTALFVPTASGDAAGYCDTFDSYYGDRLGCRTRHLTLHDDPGPEAVEADLDWADLVYVGGGNSSLLLDTWRAFEFGRTLRAAYRDGPRRTQRRRDVLVRQRRDRRGRNRRGRRRTARHRRLSGVGRGPRVSATRDARAATRVP